MSQSTIPPGFQPSTHPKPPDLNTVTKPNELKSSLNTLLDHYQTDPGYSHPKMWKITCHSGIINRPQHIANIIKFAIEIRQEITPPINSDDFYTAQFQIEEVQVTIQLKKVTPTEFLFKPEVPTGPLHSYLTKLGANQMARLMDKMQETIKLIPEENTKKTEKLVEPATLFPGIKEINFQLTNEGYQFRNHYYYPVIQFFKRTWTKQAPAKTPPPAPTSLPEYEMMLNWLEILTRDIKQTKTSQDKHKDSRDKIDKIKADNKYDRLTPISRYTIRPVDYEGNLTHEANKRTDPEQFEEISLKIKQAIYQHQVIQDTVVTLILFHMTANTACMALTPIWLHRHPTIRGLPDEFLPALPATSMVGEEINYLMAALRVISLELCADTNSLHLDPTSTKITTLLTPTVQDLVAKTQDTRWYMRNGISDHATKTSSLSNSYWWRCDRQGIFHGSDEGQIPLSIMTKVEHPKNERDPDTVQGMLQGIKAKGQEIPVIGLVQFPKAISQELGKAVTTLDKHQLLVLENGMFAYAPSAQQRAQMDAYVSIVTSSNYYDYKSPFLIKHHNSWKDPLSSATPDKVRKQVLLNTDKIASVTQWIVKETESGPPETIIVLLLEHPQEDDLTIKTTLFQRLIQNDISRIWTPARPHVRYYMNNRITTDLGSTPSSTVEEILRKRTGLMPREIDKLQATMANFGSAVPTLLVSVRSAEVEIRTLPDNDFKNLNRTGVVKAGADELDLQTIATLTPIPPDTPHRSGLFASIEPETFTKKEEHTRAKNELDSWTLAYRAIGKKAEDRDQQEENTLAKCPLLTPDQHRKRPAASATAVLTSSTASLALNEDLFRAITGRTSDSAAFKDDPNAGPLPQHRTSIAIDFDELMDSSTGTNKYSQKYSQILTSLQGTPSYSELLPREQAELACMNLQYLIQRDRSRSREKKRFGGQILPSDLVPMKNTPNG